MCCSRCLWFIAALVSWPPGAAATPKCSSPGSVDHFCSGFGGGLCDAFCANSEFADQEISEELEIQRLFEICMVGRLARPDRTPLWTSITWMAAPHKAAPAPHKAARYEALPAR